MKILILGGTAWLGGAVATAAIAAGHEVVCLARGAEVPAGAGLIRRDRAADGALGELRGTRWDAVVDLATEPGHVRRAVRDLADAAERFLYVSSASVYASLAEPGVREDAELHAPLVSDEMRSMEQYAAAKSACEAAVRAGFGEGRSIIIRPGLIGGPGDPTGRTSYWPLRFAEGARGADPVLIPDAPRCSVSIIDVRDLARWIVDLLEHGASGTFNATGDPVPLADYLGTAREVAGALGTVVPAPEEWLLARGVLQWAGPRSLPLWIAEETMLGLGAVSNERAKAAGLVLRSTERTVRDTVAWARETGTDTVLGAGLTAEDEQGLIGELRRWQ